jgi:hypothetical protein
MDGIMNSAFKHDIVKEKLVSAIINSLLGFAPGFLTGKKMQSAHLESLSFNKTGKPI